MFEELAEVSPKKGVPPNPTLRTQVRRPSKGAQPSDPSLAIGSSAAPVARGRRPSHPKVPEGAVNSQGWVREPAPMHGAAALAGYADKSTSSGSRVLHRDGPEHTSNMDDAEGVLCVNSLVPTRAPDLPGTAAGPSSERQKPSPTRAGENLKGEPSLKSLKDTLCKLEEDKERPLSHAAKCKKTFDRLAMVNAFQTPAMAARIKATASSESNIVPEELAQGEQNAHTGANAIAVRSVSGANAAPSAERIDSIEVAGAATEPQGQFVTEGRTTLSDDGNAHAGADAPAAASSSTASALVAPFGEGIKSVELAGTTSEGQFITADSRTWPSSTPQGPPSHGETSLGNSGAASQPAGPSGTQPASSHSGRHRGAAAPPPSGPSTCGSGSGALSKRRNSSPAPRQATDAGGGMGGMGGGLQLSGVKAELSSHQQRPASGKRQQASKSPETVQTHDYLRRGASRIASGASGRPRSRSRGREELRAEGRHVEMSGIDGLPGHYTGNQEYDGSRGLRSMGNKGNQAASGNPNASQAGKHPDQASTSTCGSMAGAPGAGAEASVRSTTNASRGGKDQQSTVSDAPRPTKEVEELDIEVDEVDVEEHSIKNHMKQLRRLLLVMRLWTGTKGERNGEGDDAADNQADGSQRYTNPPPGSGAVLSLILNILKGYNMTGADRKDINSSVLTYHRIVEAFKFAYAYRALLGDEDFWDVDEIVVNMTDTAFGESLRQKIYDNRTFLNFTYYGDFYSSIGTGGTSSMSVISPDGDAVAATNTINLYFGSKYRSTRTGIIYNNEMDDFSTPGKKNAFGVEPSESNFIEAFKRPMSSMSPTIFLDKEGVPRLVVGASGGTKITTAISLVVMNYLWFNQTLSQSVVDPRLHHQLLPMYIRIDEDYPMSLAIQEGLQRLGHEVRNKTGYAVVQAAATNPDGKLYGKADPRKRSWAAGF